MTALSVETLAHVARWAWHLFWIVAALWWLGLLVAMWTGETLGLRLWYLLGMFLPAGLLGAFLWAVVARKLAGL